MKAVQWQLKVTLQYIYLHQGGAAQCHQQRAAGQRLRAGGQS